MMTPSLATDSECFTILRRKCLTFSLPQSRTFRRKLKRPTCRLCCSVVGLDTISGTEQKNTKGKGSFLTALVRGLHCATDGTLSLKSLSNVVVLFFASNVDTTNMLHNIICLQSLVFSHLITTCGNNSIHLQKQLSQNPAQ